MIKKLITIAILSTMTFSAMASNVNDLSSESSWEDILNTRNVELKGDAIRVGGINTSVFFVEEKDGVLYTLKPTKDGFYKRVHSGRENDRQVWVDEGESIKSGNVTISVPQYERKRINSDRDQMIFTGYKDYTQELTRTIEVYEVVRRGGDKNDKERFLFKKEFTVPKKM
tara:strand:- start:52511 stop:53020 length:510 start_codon:yes stop_codon:yes gene_type:complete